MITIAHPSFFLSLVCSHKQIKKKKTLQHENSFAHKQLFLLFFLLFLLKPGMKVVTRFYEPSKIAVVYKLASLVAKKWK